jgi:inosose dehydratase
VVNGAFTMPGDGTVDFAGVLGVRDRANYRGWLVVEAEQDPAVAPSYAFGDKGYRHLDEIVRALQAGTLEAA